MRRDVVRTAVLVLLLTGSMAGAQTSFQWTGAVDPNWSTSGNWIPVGPPSPGDLVTINGTPTIVMDIDGDLSALSVLATANFTSVGGVLGIGAGGLTRSGGTQLTFDSTMAVILTADQTWSFNGGQNSVAGNLVGLGFTMTKTGLGSLSFSGDNTQLSAIVWNLGTLNANSAGALSGAFTLGGGTLNLGAPNTSDYVTSLVANGTSATLNAQTTGNRYTVGTLTINPGMNLTLGGLSGAAGTVLTVRGLTLNGTLTKTGAGTALWVAGPASGSGAITLRTPGTSPSGSGLDQGLHFTQTNTVSLPISNGPLAGTSTILGADSGATLTYTGALNVGAGTLVLTPRTAGIIVLGSGATVTTSAPMLFRGDGTGTVRLSSSFAFPAVDLTVDSLTWETNANSLPTSLTFTSGTWAVRTAAQTLAGTAAFNGATTLDTGTDLTLSGTVSGAGPLTKTGAGTLTFSTGGGHTGGITMAANGGTLVVGGTLSGEGAVSVGANDTLLVSGSLSTTGVSVASGGALSGPGSIIGGVNVASGATLTPGSGGTGMLTTGGLVLGDTTSLNFTLGTSSTSATVGALTLDGVLNVTAGTGFGQGTFTLFNYTGSLSNGVLRTGSLPAGFSYAYNATGGQVTLIVGPPATAVKLVRFDAVTSGDSTQISWQAGTEIQNLGYRLYREEGGRRIPVTSDLVAGSSLRVGADLFGGSNYAFPDPAGYAGARYWLETIDTTGNSEWFGPTQARSGSVTRAQVQSAMLVANVGTSPLVAGRGPLARLVDPLPGRQWNEPSYASQWTLASTPAIKLLVQQDGVYRVTAESLFSAGLPPRTPISTLQLSAGGRQIAFRTLSADGFTLQPGDALEFFGQAADTRWTDKRVYWVTTGLGAPTGLTVSPEVTPSSVATSFLETLEIRDRTLHLLGLPSAGTDGFYGKLIAGNTPVDRVFSTPALDLTSGEQAVLEVTLQGTLAGAHLVDVKVNGTTVGSVQSVFRDVAKATFTLPAGALIAGDNTVTLTGRTSKDIAVEISQRLTYPRLYSMSGPLRFTAPGGALVQLLGNATAGAYVLDVTSPWSPSALVTGASADATNLTAPGTGLRVLYAYRDQDVLTPTVVANVPSAWHAGPGADLVIIGPRSLLPSLQPLADARTREGLQVALVDIEDVYDEFSAGLKDATAIRSFLMEAVRHWSVPPRFVLLAGAASYDPRGYRGHPELDQVPTLLVQTKNPQTNTNLETASDDALVTFDPTGPALAIGRLPLSTPADMDAAVAKILSRRLAGAADLLLLARDRDREVSFSAASAEVRAALSTWKAQEVARAADDEDGSAVHAALIPALRTGPIAVDYQGHGTEDMWALNMLAPGDSDALAHAGSSSLVVAATCLNAYFVDIGRESLGPALLKVPDGAAWAVWASSGMTVPTEHPLLSKTLLSAVLNEGLTLGEATLKAKKMLTDLDVRATFHLLGDPSARSVATKSAALTISKPKSAAGGCSTPGGPIAALAPLVLAALALSLSRRTVR